MAKDTQADQAGWGVIVLLAAAQFVMVIDATVMNVSISRIVEDLAPALWASRRRSPRSR